MQPLRLHTSRLYDMSHSVLKLLFIYSISVYIGRYRYVFMVLRIVCKIRLTGDFKDKNYHKYLHSKNIFNLKYIKSIPHIDLKNAIQTSETVNTQTGRFSIIQV